LPYVPGAEVAGVVRSAPADAHVSAGDRVAALTLLSGAMAEVVALPADRVFKLPDSVSFEAGAGLLFNDLTVRTARYARAGVCPLARRCWCTAPREASARRPCGWRLPSGRAA
jgi:NADPH:quinone reductase